MVHAESPPELTEYITDAITLSVTAFETKHNTTLHNDSVLIFLDWLPTHANISLTVTPSDTIHFTGDINLYAKATHHKEAITAIQNAAKTLCDVTHPPLKNTVDDALTGTVDNDIDYLRYELTYDTETDVLT